MQNGMIVKNLPFKVGRTMTVVGIPELDSSRAEINIGIDEHQLALHFCARFNSAGDHNKVVCNSFQSRNWGEEVRGESFPFRQGQEFKVIIDFTPTKFVITLSDGSTINFPNRIGADEYSAMNLQGEVQFISLQIN
ncbi:beta-galactoside-binding lectin-like [Salarias fasciatus]|uniref:Galectin n=1 Tax=Salarias fasciatus TaxID=181472 RepID=A0A672FPR8_SALFA|nr:beta-galactoside-binding lectin-like [Salarias fasciatus]